MTTNTLRTYYQLTKPGIIQGNLVTGAAGFLLASQGHINLWLMITFLVGMSLVIASACVCNNVLDRDIDQHMRRTSKRALVTGTVKVQPALVFAALLSITGFIVLLAYVNVLTALVGLVGWVDYVALYGLAKRRWPTSTLIGSVAGATPPLAGYLAVTNHFDAAAWLLFLILTFWQMPHFYAIAMYRLQDYKSAGIPILPAVRGLKTTRVRIMLYIFFFTIATVNLSFFGYAGKIHLLIGLLLGLGWLAIGVKNYAAKDEHWGKQMFVTSLVVITTTCLTIALNAIKR